MTTKAGKFRERRYKTIELPSYEDEETESGHAEIKIQRLKMDDIVAATNFPLAEIRANTNADDEEISNQWRGHFEEMDVERGYRMMVETIRRGVVEPRIATQEQEESGEVPDDCIVFADIEDDMLVIFRAILKKSGLSKEVAEQAGTFRTES